jgi:hypothetical protein
VTSPWSREHAERLSGDQGSIEIELVETAPPPRQRPPTPAPAPGQEGDRHHRDMRVPFVLAGVLALIAIGTVAVVVSSADDSAGGPPATTLDPFDLASEITTPPLPELDTVPPANVVAPEQIAPVISLPEFPTVAGVPPDTIDSYDLVAAAATNADMSVPRRSIYEIQGLLGNAGSTSIDLASDEAVRQVTVASDPDTQRDSLYVRFVGVTTRAVVDRAADLLYTASSSDGDTWFASDAATGLVGTNTSSYGQLFDALISGPITPALLQAATVTAADEIVRLDGGAFARRYDVVVPVDAIASFGPLLFAGLSEATVAQGGTPAELTFRVYVTDQPELALVTSQFELDGETLVFTQFFDRRPANVAIALPQPDQVIPADT